MSIVISIEDVWKEYRLGVLGHGTLTHDLQSWWASIRNKKDPNSRISEGELNDASSYDKKQFWALRGVHLEIKQGEVLGIIGRNGAGKSTLLKILSRVTAPTKGRIKVRGRIASLLEVGTGFHPELTGRENIFLNGAILGMTKKEVSKKLDEIIDFSGVKQHIDTPVKRYSSGMHVRLAFAVAAHLEPEILVVDEVLAVGDAEFQKKCLGKMGEVASGGRTVLFVSHNLNSISRLCSSACLLNQGRLLSVSNDVGVVVAKYLKGTGQGNAFKWGNPAYQYHNKFFQPLSLFITRQSDNTIVGVLSNDQDYVINIEAQIDESHIGLQVGYALYNEQGQILYMSFNTDTDQGKWSDIRKGRVRYFSKIPKRFLNEGLYSIELLSALYHVEWICGPGKSPAVISFEISSGLSDSPYWTKKRSGEFAPVIPWECERVPEGKII